MRKLMLTAIAAITACSISGCATHTHAPSTANDVLDVVATTPIIADLASHVVGDRGRVTGIMPLGADPHSYEPGLRSVRNIANADVVFSNGLLLEEQSLLKTLTQSRRPDVPLVPLAEQAPRFGAQLLPLVENIALDTIWLGMRVSGTGESLGAQRTSSVTLAVRNVVGPGDAAAYITSTFGVPEVLFNSKDGLDTADATVLPVDAHTHVSWAFSKPGVYTIEVQALLDAKVPVGSTTITIAVGVNPHTATDIVDPIVVDHGHIDITSDLDTQQVLLRGDAPVGTDTAYNYDPQRTVLFVPSSVLQQIPADPTFKFLGTPGDETYLLPQAVLGKHVHGEVDPHVWHSVKNAIAMVRVIEETLSDVDPSGRAIYREHADAYVRELEDVDKQIRALMNSIEPSRRQLVTTHDAYGYFGTDYGLNIAGFVTPNPAVEPSPRDVIALTRTLENLQVPAVFLEPKLAGRAGVLTETAARLQVEVCTIRGDTLDAEVSTYLELMRTNAMSVSKCLKS